jgi:nicotinate phosphoribosyltransferase
VASNDINEDSIRSLISRNHKIDVFGIGTNLVTCQAQPALGMVYKVCEFRGLPRIKISEEPEKTTIPGSKKILRAYDAGNSPIFDVLCLESEATPLSEMTVYDRVTGQEHVAPRVEQLSTLIFSDGKAIESCTLKSQQERCLQSLDQFGGFEGLIQNKTTYPVYVSGSLKSLIDEMTAALQ